MDAYLENGQVPAGLITAMIARRQVFPCLFGTGILFLTERLFL